MISLDALRTRADLLRTDLVTAFRLEHSPAAAANELLQALELLGGARDAIERAATLQAKARPAER